MLDRKTDDFDASVELLEDKQKQVKNMFFLFYIMGACLTVGNGLFLDINLQMILIGVGLSFLFVATWIFIGYMQYNFYLFLINKGLVDAVKVKDHKVKKVKKK